MLKTVFLMLFVLYLRSASAASTFTAAEKAGDDSTVAFSLGLPDLPIRIDAGGGGTAGGKKFKLSIGKSDHVDRVLFLDAGRNVLIGFGYSDDEGGSSQICSFKKSKFRQNWCYKITGFNLGPVLLDRSDIYFAASGTVGKLSAQTGKVKWERTDLYSKYHMVYAKELRLNGQTLRSTVSDSLKLREIDFDLGTGTEKEGDRR